MWTHSALSQMGKKTWLLPRCTNELWVGWNGKVKQWEREPFIVAKTATSLPLRHGNCCYLCALSCVVRSRQNTKALVQVLHWRPKIPLPQFAKRTCFTHPSPSNLPHLVWAQRKAVYLFSLLWIAFWLFSSESYSSKEPEWGNIPMWEPLTTTSICMAEHLSEYFAVCTWHRVPTLERCTGRDLL